MNTTRKELLLDQSNKDAQLIKLDTTAKGRKEEVLTDKTHTASH